MQIPNDNLTDIPAPRGQGNNLTNNAGNMQVPERFKNGAYFMKVKRELFNSAKRYTSEFRMRIDIVASSRELNVKLPIRYVVIN